MDKMKNINYEFNFNDYDIIRNGNHFNYSIYNVNTNKMNDACKFLDTLEKPNYVSIYKLPKNQIINKNDIVEIINGTITTVKKYNNKKIIDISKFLSSNNIVYLYTDNYNCKNEYSCLYIPDLTDIINRYNYTYTDKIYKIPENKLGKIKKQGKIGSCQAFSTIEAIEMIHNNTINFSESGIYYTSRFAKNGGLLYEDYLNADDKITSLKNYNKEQFDIGLLNKNIINSLSYYGTCLESTNPYNIKKFNEITQECIHEGINYKIKDYHLIENPYNNRDLVINEIKYYLNNNVPVIFGIITFDPLWENIVNGELKLPSIKDKNSGSHAMLLVGYDDEKQIFWFKNSWGTNFGVNMYSESREKNNNGYGYFSYDYIYAYLQDQTAIDNTYLVDGFMVVLSQYNGTKLNHINPNVKVLYSNDIDDNLNIKFESTKDYFLNLFNYYNIEYKNKKITK